MTERKKEHVENGLRDLHAHQKHEGEVGEVVQGQRRLEMRLERGGQLKTRARRWCSQTSLSMIRKSTVRRVDSLPCWSSTEDVATTKTSLMFGSWQRALENVERKGTRECAAAVGEK
jgi:hypothetical protein